MSLLVLLGVAGFVVGTIPLQAWIDAKYLHCWKSFNSRYIAFLFLCGWEVMIWLFGLVVGWVIAQ